ncbi:MULTISPECIES: DUF4249 domain-containing protein [unclassified Prevotella]|uniref:DUF4249 domain-containing protein n=1 Tax=unclassified Prevotella TaxID=2638335 RepID=UPI00048F282A|nr:MULTISPECIES: DUF4249 domain-containing protein [unclassified Prevotella]
MRRLLFIIICCGVFLSCEKEIVIDYHEAESRLVIEGHLSASGTEIRVSKTNAMSNNAISSEVNNAVVKLTGSDGTMAIIPFSRDGYYRSKLKGIVGTQYQLDVEVDGQHYISTSTMQRTPKMNAFRLVWKKMLTERYLFGDLRLQDLPNESNWYFMHIYRNGIGYRWAVMKDEKNPNKELQQLFTFFRDGDHDSDVLQDGDKLRVVIRAIDQRAYDYLYSMQQMTNTNTNPVDNFTGGCLGYFSAYGEIEYYQDFYYSDVVEDDE